MAHDPLSLADLLIINDKNLADLEISDVLDESPVLKALTADVASNGTQHKYTKQTGAPVVGFRAVNVGRELDSSVDTAVTLNLQILDASFQVDLALANGYGKGPAALVAKEGKRHLAAAMFGAERQIFYGVGADAGGFVGLADATHLNGLADEMVVSATGATALTSVYLLRSPTTKDGVCIIGGNDGKIDIDETVVIQARDGDGKVYPALWTPVTAWLALQIAGARDVARIANIGTAAGKTLTDALIYEAMSRMPKKPTHIAMNRRSREQLRKSRTATNATGQPAPTPEDVEGVPILCTDAIINDETAVE
ncbi:MAG: hypothetical protein QM775_16690 [Pirellulales bacterium]